VHVIYLVRRGRKYHTDQSHRILLTHYFFTSGTGRHFDLSPLPVQLVTTRLWLSSLELCHCENTYFAVQGRSRSSMLVPQQSSSAVLVMIRSNQP